MPNETAQPTDARQFTWDFGLSACEVIETGEFALALSETGAPEGLVLIFPHHRPMFVPNETLGEFLKGLYATVDAYNMALLTNGSEKR